MKTFSISEKGYDYQSIIDNYIQININTKQVQKQSVTNLKKNIWNTEGKKHETESKIDKKGSCW